MPLRLLVILALRIITYDDETDFYAALCDSEEVDYITIMYNI